MAQQMEDFVGDEADTTPKEYRIVPVAVDFTLEELYKKWKSGKITVSGAQRNYTWTDTQASRLIESFMTGLPVPQVYMLMKPDKKMQIIDGVQRLMSVFAFFDGRFEGGDEFRIVGINKDNALYGRVMSEIGEVNRIKFSKSPIRCIIINQIGHDSDDTSIYHVFERLNTGSTRMKDQEIRSCIYEGRLNDMLTEINGDGLWRAVLGRQDADEHKRDVEIILRYLALLHDGANYGRPMKDFLSRYMNSNKNPSDVFIEKERNAFLETCRILSECGSRPLNPDGPVRAAVFDAVFVAFGKNRGARPDNVCARVRRLLDDADFAEQVNGASEPVAVRRRLEIAENILFG